MQKVLSTALAGLVLATTVITSVPASAQRYDGRSRYVERYCAENPRDRDCRSWRRDRGWDDTRYRRWYRDHHRNNNDAAAAALFGFAAGAFVAGAAGSGSGNSHIEACQARYRSYDIRTDTYMGYDGRRHRCTAF